MIALRDWTWPRAYCSIYWAITDEIEKFYKFNQRYKWGGVRVRWLNLKYKKTAPKIKQRLWWILRLEVNSI